MAAIKDEKKHTDPLLNHFQSMLDSQNYRQLADTIQHSVDQAITASKKGIKAGEYQIQKNIKAIRTQSPFVGKSKREPKKTLAPVARTPAGTFSGPFLAVGSGLFLLFSAIFGINILISGLTPVLGVAFCIFAGLGTFTAFKAKSLMERVSRFKQYLKAIDLTCPSVTTAALSEFTGRKTRYLRSDLAKMIQLKMFPEGHLSADGKTLLLTHDAYRDHLENLEKETIQREKDQKLADLEKVHPELKEAHETIRQGEKMIREITAALSDIRHETIRSKISKIISITEDILENVKQYPEHLPVIRRFIQYYLPMTLKIVDAYRELSSQSIQNETVRRTLVEIETSLDTILSAYRNLYEQLCHTRTLDISSDLSVIKTMLARDGLTE